jgi:predicted DNA-binding transcriptional regulator AlpA
MDAPTTSDAASAGDEFLIDAPDPTRIDFLAETFRIFLVAAEEDQRRATETTRSDPAQEREHLTLRQLVSYSGWSERWLRDRTKDLKDPLPCAKRGGKLMFRRSEYDRWIARQRRREPLSGVVDDMMARLGRP